uniref:Uncharacterized protein n=1 Tax=viral metagenome TaxID=1070528 RepID=A0A6C0EXP3_9ZZZZ
MDNSINLEIEIEIENANKERETFLNYIDDLHTIDCLYEHIEMDNNSQEQEEILFYINEHCSELRELINKLYETKITLMKQGKQKL